MDLDNMRLISTSQNDAKGENRADWSLAKKAFLPTPQTSLQLKGLNILTPPSSAECSSPSSVPRNEFTPRSHHNRDSPSTILPKEFISKCNLSSITRGTSSISSHGLEAHESFRTPKKKCVNPTLSFNIDFNEYKENSPIKLECVSSPSSCWFSNKPLQSSKWCIKPPPLKLSATSIEHPNYKDVLTCLHEKGMLHVLNKILDHLRPSDILRAAAVSVSWRQIVTSLPSPEAFSSARRTVLSSKENFWEGWRGNEKSKTPTIPSTPRKLSVVPVRNNIISPKRPSPAELSPNTKRFCQYLEEGKSLKKNERLERCPRCEYPGRNVDGTATCSGCNFSFCVYCRCCPHPGVECNNILSLSPPRLRRDRTHYPIGSKTSKKALRRLL